ncbi:unnamed protein product [Strongylus vulgaris]|uniref:Uncharacterized protein n=1 Tax=Strongylus vulgaris TaxID=40348 RepID=A0A3P7IVY7_STRVU|nr:unnamed protein product [Strongylus vulgaris]
MPKLYGRTVKYTYEYDPSGNLTPNVKISCGNFVHGNANANFFGRQAQGVKSLKRNKIVDTERLRPYASYSSEQSESDEDRPSSPREDSSPERDDSHHIRYTERKHVPGTRYFHREGPSPEIEDLMDDISSFMYQQARDILSSEFPEFPNLFENLEHGPSIKHHPHFGKRRYHSDRNKIRDY